MPGRLMMEDQSSATGSQGFKKDRSHALEVGANQGAVQLDQSHPNGPVSNGPNSVLSNGIPPEGQSNGAGLSQENLGPPPPLDQSWREGVENKSLGKLMIRTAEKCFTDLNDLLASMANQKIPQQAVQANGATPEQDTDAVSLNKKSRLMDFAQQQRERFIKTLVINDWCRDAEAFAGIIDVNAHLGRTNFCHAQATTAVGETKLAMNQAKMPNPNIEAAFELLATGKSDLPSLGYINPPKITAKELLRTLRDMNVTLATRLTLHEELPNNLNEYSIADGRATFTVPGEFAVDLAVASEDPTSPFFYIDLRFLFSPAPAQLNEQIQNYCEAEVNKAIASKGLQGCYDVLHNFVLTHKLNVLHSQTTDLVRGKWFECICVERIRRMFILSYWTGRPGRKSWIELGIGSGKTKDGGASQKTTPIIASRWFQRGVEVQNAKLDIDWHRIDLESILLQAIAKHVSSLLGHVRDDLRRLAPANTKFTADLSTSDHDPDECALTLRLPSLRAPIRLAIEPVTGQITISPSTEATRKTQERLNNDPTVDMPRRAASMLCAVALEQVNKQAENIDWKLVLDLVRQDNLRAIFGDDLWQRNVYMPSEKWGRSWAIAVTVGLRGCQWWIVQLREVNDLHHRAIINARKLRLPEASNAKNEMPSRQLLLQLEKAALAEVSYTSLAMELDHLNIPHHLEKPLLILGNNRTRQWTFQTMFLNFSKLMNPTQDKNWKPWAQELVRLTHHGRDNAPDRKSERLFVRHELRLALQKKTFNELRKHLSQTSRDRDLAMNDKGGLAIRFRTPFGAPFLEQIRSKLSAIRRLDHYLEVLKSCRIKCDVATLSRLEFTYSSNPPLSAHLAFSSNDGKQTTRLRLEPPDSNPHLFVRTILEQNLNSESPEAFAHTVRILQLSLPILRTVEQLQSDHPERQSLVLHARSASWYSLKYKPPLPQITFTIRTRTKVEAGAGGGKRSVRWHVEQERTKANADSLPEELLKALRELWSSDDKHYLGLGSGVAADVEGIGIVLERIDGIVRRYQSASGSGGGDDIPPNGAAGKQEVIALD